MRSSESDTLITLDSAVKTAHICLWRMLYFLSIGVGLTNTWNQDHLRSRTVDPLTSVLSRSEDSPTEVSSPRHSPTNSMP